MVASSSTQTDSLVSLYGSANNMSRTEVPTEHMLYSQSLLRKLVSVFFPLSYWLLQDL